MRKSKEQKAITLIALIITIVVLLILAAVAISSIQNDGILHYAQNAADSWNKAMANEANMLGDYLNYLNNMGSGNGGGTGIGDATVGTPVTSLSTINGQQYSANNPVIPAGFMAIDSGADWNTEDLAAEVKKGLVISDGTSEFVWIPVPTISEMAKEKDTEDANGRTNYEGVLYDFSKESNGTLKATEKTGYGQSTTSYREPANLTSSGYADNADRFTLTTIKSAWDTDYYQESFNKMVESVAEYKGFYVGRYEMSLSASGTAQSVAGATSATNSADSANMWWGLYEKATTYSTSGVISEMIWGCQYDAMLRWMKGNNIDVTNKTPTDTNRNVTASKNTTRVTGSENSNDILNNVYDILGNSQEWTQEADLTGDRVNRGGRYNSSGYPSIRGSDFPTNTNGIYGSRLTLYIEM